MDKTYCYTAIAGWNGSERNAAGAPEITRVIPFSAPPEFGGQASVWSPEHLLLGAVATCYVSTFRAIAGFSKLTFRAIDVSAEGTIEKQEGGLRFTRITLKPVVTIEREEDRERARKILEKAERGCLVSRSLACQVMLERRSNLRKP